MHRLILVPWINNCRRWWGVMATLICLSASPAYLWDYIWTQQHPAFTLRIQTENSRLPIYILRLENVFLTFSSFASFISISSCSCSSFLSSLLACICGTDIFSTKPLSHTDGCQLVLRRTIHVLMVVSLYFTARFMHWWLSACISLHYSCTNGC